MEHSKEKAIAMAAAAGALPLLASSLHKGYYLLLGLEPHAFLLESDDWSEQGSLRSKCGVMAREKSE